MASHLSKNLEFIGKLIYGKKNSKSKYTFNVAKLARYLEVTDQSIHKWLRGDKISKTQLKRAAIKLDNIIDHISITPEKLLNYNLEIEYKNLSNKINEPGPVYYVKSKNDTDIKIHEYLKKYPYMKPPILEILKKHDKK